MLFKATAEQTAFLLKRKGAVCVFYVLLVMVIANFIGNVLNFQGRDVVEMYHPMRLLLLSYDRTNFNASNTLLLIQLYPLLVVCPAGFSLAREYQLGTRVFLVSRIGNVTYQISRFLAAFLTTMIIFTVPFLLEILLNCLAFPLSAMGNLANWSIYSSAYLDGVSHYLMKGIYNISPYLYAVIGTLFFGAVSGLLGAFTVAVSSLVKVRYNILLFLPVFVALNLTTILAGPYGKVPSIRWHDYILIFNDETKNMVFGIISLLAIILFSIGAVYVSARKDCLQ